MYKVYKINETSIPAAAWRTIKKAIKLMVITYLCFNIYLIWQERLSFYVLLTSALVIVPAYITALVIGYFLIKKGYRTFRIVLDDDGVEFYIRGNDKKISWSNIKIITRPDGIIELQDRHVTAIFRIMTGEGSIQLIPEIERFDDLINEINNLIRV